MFCAHKLIPNAGSGECAELEANLLVTLENFEHEQGGGRVLSQCVVRGSVGRTQLLVSHSDLTLQADTPTTLRLRNEGMVPLELAFQGRHLPLYEGDAAEETRLLVVPCTLLLLPGQEDTVTLLWIEDPDQSQDVDRLRYKITVYNKYQINASFDL